MAVLRQHDIPIGIFLAVIICLLCFTAAQALANTENIIGLAIVLGLLIVIITFIWPEAGLYILILSMLLGPEILVGNLGGGGGTSAARGFTLRLDDFLLMIIAFAWLARGAVHKEIGLLLSTPLNQPIAAYLVVAAVSTAIGMLFDRVRPVIGFFYVLKYVEYIFVYFAAINFIQNKQQIKRLIFVIFLTGILVSLYAAAQIPFGVRVSAPFEGQTGEPNTLGGYLLLLMALFGGLLITSPGLRTAARYMLGIVVMGIPFLYTLSRASYLGIAAAVIAIVSFTRRRTIAVFTAVTFLLLLILFAPSAVVERIQYTFGGQGNLGTGQIQIGDITLDTSTSARLARYQEIIRDFPTHPIFGYGVTGYGFVDGQYPRVLIETGLVGLATFLWLLVALFWQGWLAFKTATDHWERGLCIGYMSGLAGLMMHALASNTFIIVRIMEPFWFLAGVMTLFHIFNTSGVEEEALPGEKVERVSYGLVSPYSGS